MILREASVAVGFGNLDSLIQDVLNIHPNMPDALESLVAPKSVSVSVL